MLKKALLEGGECEDFGRGAETCWHSLTTAAGSQPCTLAVTVIAYSCFFSAFLEILMHFTTCKLQKRVLCTTVHKTGSLTCQPTCLLPCCYSLQLTGAKATISKTVVDQNARPDKCCTWRMGFIISWFKKS